MPVDYFVKVNMESFRNIVDTLGGITVNSTFAFNYDGHSFSKGEITLNGEEALAYTRMRKRIQEETSEGRNVSVRSLKASSKKGPISLP